MVREEGFLPPELASDVLARANIEMRQVATENILTEASGTRLQASMRRSKAFTGDS